MLVETPGLHGRGDIALWFSGLLLGTALHVLILLSGLAQSAPSIPNHATSAVMLSFSDTTQSIQLQHTLPVGPPQVVTPESHQAQSDPQPSARQQMSVSVEETPIVATPRLVVGDDKSPPRKSTKKSAKIASKKQNVTRRAATPSEIDSRAMAQSAALPPPGNASQIAASHDSRSNDTGQITDWQARVLGYLSRNQGYPAQALAAGMEGKLLTTVTIDRQGHILSVQLRRSSGYPLLDQHALRAIERKSPIPRPPDDIIRNMSQLKLNIPVEFNVRKYRLRNKS